MEARRANGLLLIAPLALVLLLVFVLPVVLMLPTSFAIYEPGRGTLPGWTLANYGQIVTDSYFHELLGRTFTTGVLATVISALLGLPLATVLARSGGAARSWLTILVVFPLMLNVVVRSFGWISLLANRGLINNALTSMGLMDRPLRMMFNETGLVIGLTHVYLPVMVLVVAAAMRAMPRDAEAASATLGAGPLKTFVLVTVPLIAPGLFAGCVLVFVLAISALVTPRLLGGPAYKVMSTQIYDEFLSSLDWPTGAALAFTLTAAALLLILGAGALTRRWTGAQ